jgi:hypothetical protein
MTDAPVATFPPLVVGTDVEAIRKIYRAPLMGSTILVPLAAVVAVLFTAMMTSTSGFAVGVLTGMPFVAVLAFMTASAVQTAGTAAARAVPGNVLTLDATGVAATTPQGPLVLPWQAIESVELKKWGKHRIVIFRGFPGVTPESTGVQTTLKPAAFRKLATKGFRVGSLGIDVPVQTILDATAAFTAGRLVAR